MWRNLGHGEMGLRAVARRSGAAQRLMRSRNETGDDPPPRASPIRRRSRSLPRGRHMRAARRRCDRLADRGALHSRRPSASSRRHRMADFPPARARPTGASLVARNMFCSTCDPVAATPADDFAPPALLIVRPTSGANPTPPCDRSMRTSKARLGPRRDHPGDRHVTSTASAGPRSM